MAVFFFDSSTLVKRYVQESVSAWIAGLCQPEARNALYVVEITIVETVSAITRRLRRGELSSEETENALAVLGLHFASDYQQIQVSSDLIHMAALLAYRYGLRAYDAIQLAAALQLQTKYGLHGLSAITFLSADNELNNAAIAEGLSVENPNRHL